MVSAKTFSEITPVWLTAILTERGGLLAGRVLRVEQTRDPNPITQNVTLLLTYSPDASWARAGPRLPSRPHKRRLAIFLAPSLSVPLSIPVTINCSETAPKADWFMSIATRGISVS